tara:strand:- start:22334 stop:22876 length:543 start_codon:yes stop_codon:yes gene_type:complete
VRILFFVASLVLLSACVHDNGMHDVDKVVLTEKPLTCLVFTYDNSDLPCNLLGWQIFAYQALKANEEDHKSALLSLTHASENTYKKLILESSAFEPDAVREQAIQAMFRISEENINHFGHFFYLLATYQHTHLLDKQNAILAEKKLKIQIKKNAQLKKQLNDAQAKIQAIMDIEQDLKTN